MTVPFIDVTAAQMLSALATNLEGDGIRFLLARDVLGQQEKSRPMAIQTYLTVEDAVAAVLEPAKVLS